jgi:membrane-associated phospholipid phosphatase
MFNKLENLMGYGTQAIDLDNEESDLSSTVMALFWFKCIGTTGFISLFFGAYFYLLKHPASPATTMPITIADRFIGFEPLALPIYFSLWVYVSLPLMLMRTRRAIIEYGVWIGGLCVVSMLIYYFFPNAVPPSDIDWARYPGVAFLKDVDAAGNACPSLHVATAVFSGFWMHWLLPKVRLESGARLMNALWCIAIAYSAMATKQHVALDVVAGGALGAMFAWCSKPNFSSRA